MNHSARKQQHEQARKKHRQDHEEHLRELSRQKRSTLPMWFLGIGITLLLALVVAAMLY